MKKFFIALSSIVAVVFIAVVGAHFYGLQNLSAYQLDRFKTVSAGEYSVAPERGKHLATISGCNGCHGANYEGKDFINEAPIGYVPAPNLTPAGPVANYTDEDWVKAIRHGIAKDGRLMVIMPSNHYSAYGDDDLAALISYMKTLPPAENKFSSRDIQFPGSIIFGILAYESWPANQIPHDEVGGKIAPIMDESLGYGQYLTRITGCYECHGENLAGKDPDSEGEPGPNITRKGNPGNWNFEEFKKAMQTGQTPEGKILNPEKMPWPHYAVMSDVELKSLWANLNSI